jgi:hypothetical protein
VLDGWGRSRQVRAPQGAQAVAACSSTPGGTVRCARVRRPVLSHLLLRLPTQGEARYGVEVLAGEIVFLDLLVEGSEDTLP